MKIFSELTVCTIGTALEWFDFSLFACLAPVIAKIFFPSSSHIDSLLSTFALFASGFMMRPFGAIVFGHLGDRLGRKANLLATVSLMAMATVLMGLVPTGMAMSAGLLLALRLLQGFAASGEYPGVIVLLGELASAKNRGFFCSLSMCAAFFGAFLGSVVVSITFYFLNHPQIMAWGWRLPFLLGLPLGVVAVWLRSHLSESKIFQSIADQQKIEKIPLKSLLKNNRLALLMLMLMYVFTNVGFYLNFVYFPGYSAAKNIDIKSAAHLTSLTLLIFCAVIPFFGYLSDRIGRRKTILLSCLMTAVFNYPLFFMIVQGSFAEQCFAQLALAVLVGMFAGPLAALSSEIFPANVRYSGVAIAQNVGASLFGSTAPLVCAWLLKETGNLLAPGHYFFVIALINVMMVITTFKTQGLFDDAR